MENSVKYSVQKTTTSHFLLLPSLSRFSTMCMSLSSVLSITCGSAFLTLDTMYPLILTLLQGLSGIDES